VSLPGDRERWVTEPRKDTGGERGPFERDRGRVLHSAGFRRLAAKTQVHTAGSDDFLRTRLTHSLEVAQIAREMGTRLGCDPDVVDVAGLAHDLGHPPFGHNGEDALNEVAQSCGGFEGNAQTLRVLTRLEAKILGAGLNLTRASLDATCKYPWPRRPDTRKFGVYADDLPVFEWLRAGTPGGDRRCLEAQVMDWSDDVAYSVHDVEDGVFSGYIQLRELIGDQDQQAALCADVAAAYSAEPVDVLREALAELLTDPVLARLAGYDGSHRAQAMLKDSTSILTGRLVAAAVTATRAAYPGRRSRYAADLVVPPADRIRCALLKGIALRYVMRRRGMEPWYSEQRQILRDLVGVLCERAPDGLDPVFAAVFKEAADDAARTRIVIDQVASLTDPAALAWHDRLC
jgi:dGTPase